MWAARTHRLVPALAGAAVSISGLNHSERVRSNRFLHCHETSFSPDDFRPFPVLEVRTVGPRVNVLKCGLPSSDHVMGLPVSSFVMVSGPKAGGTASAYTPITTDDQPGYFELLVKGYVNGVVSSHLCSLKAGDVVLVKGPVTKLPYTANMKKKIGMIAGGSGITPMLQILKEIVKDPSDKTEVTLVYGNQTPVDILLREELTQLAASSKGQIKVVFAVDRNSTNDGQIHHVGYVTKELLARVLPAPSADTLVYICGPPEMLKAVAGPKGFVKGRKFGQGEIGGLLQQIGYSIDMVFKL